MNWDWAPQKDESAYKIFTTDFDEVLTGNELVSGLSQTDREIWDEKIEVYRKSTSVERTKASIESLSFVDEILNGNAVIASRTAVSILIDHSGSLNGQKAIITCLLVEVIADFLARLGVHYEILGFTTSEWKGGQSRKRWLASGRPARPGRLNDLLHIVYREAASTNPGTPWSIRNLLREDLLKENIDGEALFWATERLKNLNNTQNLIVVISDGAPADDSTLNENEPHILVSHLKLVIEDILNTPGFNLTGIGIDHDVSSFYPGALRIDQLKQISQFVPEFLGKFLKGEMGA